MCECMCFILKLYSLTEVLWSVPRLDQVVFLCVYVRVCVYLKALYTDRGLVVGAPTGSGCVCVCMCVYVGVCVYLKALCTDRGLVVGAPTGSGCVTLVCVCGCVCTCVCGCVCLSEGSIHGPRSRGRCPDRVR